MPAIMKHEFDYEMLQMIGLNYIKEIGACAMSLLCVWCFYKVVMFLLHQLVERKAKAIEVGIEVE